MEGREGRGWGVDGAGRQGVKGGRFGGVKGREWKEKKDGRIRNGGWGWIRVQSWDTFWYVPYESAN